MIDQQQQQVPSSTSSIEDTAKSIESGVDFILSHFEEPLFPRKISTYKSQKNKPFQFSVSNKQEIINSFVDSNFVNCKINAYPYLIEYKGIQRYRPNLLFIDLDLPTNNNNSQSSITALKLALLNTLRNIKEKLKGYPTVLGSGNGYHIIQPVYCPTALENIIEFEKFDKPSQEFLRFAKHYFSNGRADEKNHPSFRSCLLRVPGSINSKNNRQVTIVQKWNGYTPKLTLDLMDEYLSYLIQKKIDENNLHHRQKILNARRRKNRNNNNYSYYYDWIEKLVLQTPIEDGRKKIIELVLSPYFILIKKLSYEETFRKIKEWLHQCDSLSGRRLDFDITDHVNSAIKTVHKKQIPPMSIYKLKTKYSDLYLSLLDQKNNNNSTPTISNQTNRERGV